MLKSSARFLNLSRILTPKIRRISARQWIHIPATTCAKLYPNTETNFTYKFVQKYETIEPSKEDVNKHVNFVLENSYSDKSAGEIVDAFEGLSYHCMRTGDCISNDIYDELVKEVIKRLDEVSDEQLLGVLQNLKRFPETENPQTKNFYLLWRNIDDVCYNRASSWKDPMLLRVCNIWFQLYLSRLGTFTRKAVVKVTRKIERLDAKTFVEVMFYLSLTRTPAVDMVLAEKHFMTVLHQLSLNEIGVVCITYFKTQTKLKSGELLEALYRRTIAEIDTVGDITMVNILKVLRYSSDPKDAKFIEILSEILYKRLDKFSLLTCLHIALLGSNIQYCHQHLIEAIVRRFNDNIKELRLKDFERIAFVMGLFDFKTESQIEKEFQWKIIEELKTRVDEIVKHPKCLSACAHYLSLCNVYDVEILRSVLSPEFIKIAYGSNLCKVGREVLSLDGYAEINLKGIYSGPRLTEKMRRNITKFQTTYVPVRGQKYRLTHADQLSLELKELLEKQHGPNFMTFILPHYQRPDIIYCFDKNGKSVTKELTEHLPDHYSGKILSKDFLLSRNPQMADNINDYTMVAVILGGWNFYMRDSATSTGGLRLKVDQLKLVGYETILVHWNKWAHSTLEEKENYLDGKIKRILKL